MNCPWPGNSSISNPWWRSVYSPGTSPTKNRYNDISVFTCLSGWEIANAGQSTSPRQQITSKCNETGDWDPPIPSCTRKWLRCSAFFFFFYGISVALILQNEKNHVAVACQCLIPMLSQVSPHFRELPNRNTWTWWR